MMTDAIKRAAEAAYPTPEDTEPAARAVRQVLREGYERGWRESREALLSDREGMARALFIQDFESRFGYAPAAGTWEKSFGRGDHLAKADAIREYLLGGEA